MTAAHSQGAIGVPQALRDLNALASAAGGALFLAILTMTAIFCFALFDLRAEKIFAFPAHHTEASAEDIVAFQRGGEMALQGHADEIYDAGAYRETLSAQHQGLRFINPPHFLFVAAPLAVMPYSLAKALWLGLSIFCMALLVRLTKAHPIFYLFMLLSPAAFASLLVMQAGPMVAACLAGALFLSGRRPFLAGLLLAILTMKPQYGLFAPIFLAALGRWRAFGWAAGLSIALWALSAAVFGVAVWTAFFEAFHNGGAATHAALLHRDMVTIQQSVGKLGGDIAMRNAAQLVAILAAGILVWRSARRLTVEAAAAVTLLASAFASPSLWIYDWPLVATGIFLIVRLSSPWPLHLQAALGALWIAPLISLGAGTMESSLAAPVIFGFSLVAVRLMLARNQAAKVAESLH